MITKFRVTNFCSIGNTQEISFLISKKDVLDESARQLNDDISINQIVCVIGPNASGKTTTLKALTFALLFIGNSYSSTTDHIPYETHALWKDRPSALEIEFIEGGTLYRYSIEFTKVGITKEYFGKRVKRGFSRIFEYTRNDSNWIFKNSNELEINPSDLKRFKERKHSSVLSSLLALAYVKPITFLANEISNVDRLGLTGQSSVSNLLKISERLSKDENLKTSTLDFLKNVDLGIEDFDFREVLIKDRGSKESDEKRKLLQTFHKSSIGSFVLNFYEESNGTQHTAFLISEILPILNAGGVAILDEIESGIHPYVIKKIIALFESRKSNPKGAQLIFSTHQHILLNDRTKTQIFIAEKNMDSTETEIFRLDEFEGIRNDENYFTKYIAGSYGGTPKIDFF